MMLDSGTTSQVIAAHDLVNKHKLPSFAFANSGFWPTATIGPWLFRSMPQVKTAFPVMFPRIVKKWHPKTAAMVYTHDQEYAVNNAKVVREFLGKFNIKLVTEATGKAKDPDWRPQMTRVKAAKVDLLFLMGPGNDTGLMVKTARDMGMEMPVVGDAGMTHEDYWKLSKGRTGTTIFYIASPGFVRPRRSPSLHSGANCESQGGDRKSAGPVACTVSATAIRSSSASSTASSARCRRTRPST